MNSVILDGQVVNYIINYKSIKNIYFRVKEDNIVYVSANKFVSKKEIEKLLISNKQFIFKSLDRISKKNIEEDKILYLGNELHLVLSKNTYIDNNYIYSESIDTAKEYIYSLAYKVFEERLSVIKPLFNDLPNFKLVIRKMKTKWGVCNKRSMTVTLNTELITKDVSLIDYVIVHELSHFKHMDHSSLFWEEVSRHYPYYKQARRELNNR